MNVKLLDENFKRYKTATGCWKLDELVSIPPPPPPTSTYSLLLYLYQTLQHHQLQRVFIAQT